MAPNVSSAAAELRQEAAEARDLASTLKDLASVADLHNYACALESDAADWEGGSANGVVHQLERETRGPRQSVPAEEEELQLRGRR
jgi:hypothetical protein